jgi:heme/copper-type cytochrome/quinol oxidase subunit 2
MTAAIVIAIIMIGTAAYFIWRQRLTLRTLRADAHVPLDQRRYLLKQCQRRLFGSVVLILLAFMMIGSLFLDYQLLGNPLENVPPAEQEAAKQSFRFISIYWMTFLLLLMAVLALAVFDLWATARHGVRQQKQLLQEHQEMLESELEEHRHRQAEMN